MVKNNKEASKQKRLIQRNTHDQEYICLMGKNITPTQLEKKVRRKPRLLGTILMNFFIILIIIITIVLVVGI
jgi:hypothetical protein